MALYLAPSLPYSSPSRLDGWSIVKGTTRIPSWRASLTRTDARTRIPSGGSLLTSDEDFVLTLFKNSVPSRETMAKRWETMFRLESCIQRCYGERFALTLFGSSSYGLDSFATDLDIAIVDSDYALGGKPRIIASRSSPYDLRGLADLLSCNGFDVKRVVEDANVPIIIARDLRTNIDLDINCNCLSGVWNSLLLSSHARLSPTLFLPLAHFLKLWSRRRNLSSTSSTSPHHDRSSSINSYSLCLLLLTSLASSGTIDHLLVRKPGMIWLNEELRYDVPRTGERFTIRQEFGVGWEDGSGSIVKPTTLREELRRFFALMCDYYEVRVETSIFSFRTMRLSRRREEKRGRRPAFMFVEDPLIPERNTTGSLSRNWGARWFEECRKAKRHLDSGGAVRELLG